MKDEKKNLIGVDPLAWLSEEEKQSVLNEDKGSNDEKATGNSPESSFTINLPTAITIRNVSELMDELNDIDDKHQELIFEAENIERIDTAALQLILGFYLFSTNAGKKVIWNNPSPTLQNAVEILGLKEIINVNAIAA